MIYDSNMIRILKEHGYTVRIYMDFTADIFSTAAGLKRLLVNGDCTTGCATMTCCKEGIA